MLPLTIHTRYGATIYIGSTTVQIYGCGMNLTLSHDQDLKPRKVKGDDGMIYLLEHGDFSIHMGEDEFERITAALYALDKEQEYGQ
ncbi:hypothetical protein Q5N41_16680 [Vibrio cholerae]|uniref:hypothetical protein n=1 Tax=Vibrio cholerae TaxID=666 RepID=UPI00075B06DF|nr:hypothetical protein [Vibrio cholerae]EGR0546786.1 hypothetical protein [Vibrio cholerae]EGR0574586.1 hypothetical protein [Vibrio cholerae]EII3728840.1 hypothetical protein [Vibrio cholerae]MDV2380009.1 hypothetical protein [Vibrio cholerae]